MTKIKKYKLAKTKVKKKPKKSKVAYLLIFKEDHPGVVYTDKTKALNAMKDKKKLDPESAAHVNMKTFNSVEEARRAVTARRQARKRKKSMNAESAEVSQTEQPQQLQTSATNAHHKSLSTTRHDLGGNSKVFGVSINEIDKLIKQKKNLLQGGTVPRKNGALDSSKKEPAISSKVTCGKSKIYAVGVGRKRGIFATKEECLKLTQGISFTHYRAFSTVKDAQEYLERYAQVPLGTPNINVSNSKYKKIVTDNFPVVASPGAEMLKGTTVTPSLKRPAAEGDTPGQIKKCKLELLESASEQRVVKEQAELCKLSEEYERLRKKQDELKKDILVISLEMQGKINILNDLKEKLTFLEKYAQALENKSQALLIGAEFLLSRLFGNSGKEQLEGFDYDENNFCKIYSFGILLEEKLKSAIGVYFGKGNKLNVGQPILGSLPAFSGCAHAEAAVLACQIAKLLNIPKINIHTRDSCLFNCITKQYKVNQSSIGKLMLEDPLLRLEDAMKGLEVTWTFAPKRNAILGMEMALKLARKAAKKSARVYEDEGFFKLHN